MPPQLINQIILKLDLNARFKSIQFALKFAKNPIPGMLANFERKGPTFNTYLGGIQPSLMTKDPEIIRHVLQKNHRNYIKTPMIFEKLRQFLGNGLLTSEGAYWLQQRRLIQPGFHRQRLTALVEIMDQVIKEADDKLQASIQKGAPVDVYQMMMHLAFGIVSRSLFSTEVAADKLDFLSYSLTTIQAFLVRQIRQPFLNPWFKLSGQLKKHIDLSKAADEIILDLIRRRREATGDYDDLLQMLLEARYEDTGEGMTDQQLLEEVNIIMTAGHETSANALSWIFYLLAQHPEIVHRLQKELAMVLGDRPLSFADLPQLVYTSQVIEEGMRLYPPAWVTDRMAIADDEVNGVSIPKDYMAVLVIYALHHDPKYWPEPESFNPDRFDPEKKKQQVPYTYLPFGGGPRLCIGNNFAMMEMQMVLAYFLRKYGLSLVLGQQVEMLPLVTLRPKNGIQIYFQKKHI